MHLVCKSVITNSYLVDLFQLGSTFFKEAQFYAKIVPTIEQFEEDMNISNKLDLFIKCVGSRISLKPGTNVGNIKLQSRLIRYSRC